MAMAMFARGKRVTDPFNERVRARLFQSGAGVHDSDDHSPFMPTLIHGFFDLGDEDKEPPPDAEYSTTSDSNNDDDSTNSTAIEALQDLVPDPSSDPFRLRLHSDVIHVAELLLDMRSTDKYVQSVTTRLREMGYNAGLCKTKWASSGGLTAGNYNYIDIVVGGGKKEEKRYIVDLEFRGQFEVARATEEYEKVMEAVPRVLVGREEEVKRVVKVMAEAAKRSMKRRDISVPPWRKRRYLIAKWFGPQRRIVDCNSSVSGCVYRNNGGENIKCRSVVGFFGAAEGEKMKRSLLV